MIFLFVSISAVKSGHRGFRSMNILISVEVIGVDELPRDVFEEWEEKRKKKNLEN